MANTDSIQPATRMLTALSAEDLTVHAAPEVSYAEAEASVRRDEAPGFGYLLDKRFVGTVFGFCAIVLAVAGSYNVPTGILTTINNDIGPSAEYTNITILWTITCAVALLVNGRLSDLFGRRYFVLGGIVCGFIGAILSSESKSISMLVGAQVFTGPAAPLASAYQIYLGELMPIKHRGYMTAFVLMMCAPLQQWGPLFGQLLALRASWRWVYRISAIMWAVAFVLIATFYHPPKFDNLHVKHSKSALLKSFDWIGLVLYTIGLVLFCFGLSWGGGFFPWKSAAVISTIAIGGVVFISFFLWEAFARLDTPLVSIQFLSHQPRKFLFPFLSSTIGGMFFFGLFLIWPIEIAAVYTDLSLIQQGWYSSAVYIGTLTGSMLGGPVFQTGNAHRLKVICLNVMMIAFAAGASQCRRDQRAATTACLACAGACCGAMETMFALWIAATRSVENLGLSLGLLGSFRNVAGAVASAIYVAIINTKSSHSIAEKVSAAVVSLGLPKTSLPALFTAMSIGTAGAFGAVPGITPEIVEVVPVAVGDAYVETFKVVYYVVIAFGVLGLVFSLLSVKDISENMTNHVGKSLYNNEKRAEASTSSSASTEAQAMQLKPDEKRMEVV